MKTADVARHESLETNGTSFLATPDLDVTHAQDVSGGGVIRGLFGLIGGIFESAFKVGALVFGILW